MTLRIPPPAKNSEFLNVAFQAVIFLRNCKTRNFADFLVNIDFKILKNRFFLPNHEPFPLGRLSCLTKNGSDRFSHFDGY